MRSGIFWTKFSFFISWGWKNCEHCGYMRLGGWFVTNHKQANKQQLLITHLGNRGRSIKTEFWETSFVKMEVKKTSLITTHNQDDYLPLTFLQTQRVLRKNNHLDSWGAKHFFFHKQFCISFTNVYNVIYVAFQTSDCL